MTIADSAEPLAIRAGDSVSWTRSLPSYSADDGWTLKYRLLWPGGGDPVGISASGAGTEHSAVVSAADSAEWPADRITMLVYVERGSGSTAERVSLETKAIEILPNLVDADSFDGRSQAQKALDDARAALATYVSAGRGTLAEYEIAGRRFRFRAASEITALIAHYEREVARERGVSGRVFYRG